MLEENQHAISQETADRLFPAELALPDGGVTSWVPQDDSFAATSIYRRQEFVLSDMTCAFIFL